MTTVTLLDAEKPFEPVVLYVFRIAFTASLFCYSNSVPENWSNALVLQATRYLCIWCEASFAHLGSANRHSAGRCRQRPREATTPSRKRRRSESGEVRGRQAHDDASLEELWVLYCPPNNWPCFLFHPIYTLVCVWMYIFLKYMIHKQLILFIFLSQDMKSLVLTFCVVLWQTYQLPGYTKHKFSFFVS